MHTILSPVTFCHKFVAEEWKLLFAFIDILYRDALKFWLAKYDCLYEEEIGLCYFCYVGIKHKNQAVFLNISSQGLSKRKQRLKNKLAIFYEFSLKDVTYYSM